MGASYIDPDDGAQGEAGGFTEFKFDGVLAPGEGLGGDGDAVALGEGGQGEEEDVEENYCDG